VRNLELIKTRAEISASKSDILELEDQLDLALRRENQGVHDLSWEKQLLAEEISQRQADRDTRNADIRALKDELRTVADLFDRVKRENAHFRMQIAQVEGLAAQTENQWRMMGERDQFNDVGLTQHPDVGGASLMVGSKITFCFCQSIITLVPFAAEHSLTINSFIPPFISFFISSLPYQAGKSSQQAALTRAIAGDWLEGMPRGAAPSASLGEGSKTFDRAVNVGAADGGSSMFVGPTTHQQCRAREKQLRAIVDKSQTEITRLQQMLSKANLLNGDLTKERDR
jgi:hypothetical protein